jgi:nucleoside phosphorylase
MSHYGPVAHELTYAECRAAARAVRQTRDGRRATRVIRPFGPCLHHARPPLPVLLYLASREGRLVWESPQAFAVIEPPVARRLDRSAGPSSFRRLDLLVRAWDNLIFAGPPVLVLIAAVVVTLLWRGAAFGAIVAVLAAVAWTVVEFIVGAARLLWDISHLFSYRRPGGDGFLGAKLRSYQWILTLCHAVDSERVDPLLRGALDRAVTLTAAGLRPDRAFTTTVLACRLACATTPTARQRSEKSSLSRSAGEADWLVIGAKGRVERPNVKAVRPVGILPLMLTSTALALAAAAAFIAPIERAACAGAPCGARPVTFPVAVVWLLQHAIFRFPGPATWQSQVIGALTTVLTTTMALCAVLTLVWHRRYQAEREKLMYESLDSYFSAQTSVLVLVVNGIERKAVMDAVARHTGDSAHTTDRVASQAIYRLGSVGPADIVLGQSEQGTVSPAGMTLTAKALIDNLKPDAVILTGICYGLNSRHYDGGSQELGDVVVSTQLRTLDHRKVTVGPEGERREIIRGARPEPSTALLNLARMVEAAWTDPVIHFGPVVSLNTLLDNEEERSRIKRLEEEAIAGEMELAGLYAAAEETRTGWILIKGISDWGVGKSDAQQSDAARHAADFVVRLIEQFAPAVSPDPATRASAERKRR